MKITYKIKEVKPNIFSVVIKDGYDRAMTFCRVQEYYESPNPKFRGQTFDMWDYIEWYSKEYGRGFTYGYDWSGFNIPLEVAYNCYDTLQDVYTPYDEIMEKIVHEIYEKNGDSCKGYIIGSENTKGDIFKHEVCHGLWSTNKKYKKLAKGLVRGIDPDHLQLFKRNLLDMGYTDKVLEDEIQAYLMFGHESEDFGKNVPLRARRKYNKKFHKLLASYI